MLRSPRRVLNTALHLARSGDLNAAFRLVDELIANDPYFLDARGHRAWWHLCRGDYEASISDLEAILRLRPRDEMATALLGDCMLKLGRTSEAESHYLKALNLNPLNSTALAGLKFMSDERASELKRGKPRRRPGEDSTGGAPAYINAVIAALDKHRTATFPSSVHYSIGRFLYSLVRMLAPTVALEIGAYVGYSSLCIGQALEDMGEGHLHSVDMFPKGKYVSPFFEHPQSDGFLVASEHIHAAGLSHRISLHCGESAAAIPQIVQQHGRPQFVFVDGDHTIGGCWRDFAAIQETLEPGSVIVLHDTHPRNCGCEGPYHLMQRLRLQPFGDAYQVLNLATPDGYGLGLIQKTGDSVPLGPPRRNLKLAEGLLRRVIHGPLPEMNH